MNNTLENKSDLEVEKSEKMQENEQRGKKLLFGYLKYTSIIFLLVVAFGIGFRYGQQEEISQNFPKDSSVNGAKLVNIANNENEVDFSLFWDVWDTLNEKYVSSGDLDAQELVYGSINGMLGATGDPYTVFLSPEETQQFSSDMEGKFEGIGAEIGIKKGTLTVVAPLDGSPAETAGLRAGDKILKIDGESTAEMGINEAVMKIRGEKSTDVTLTVFRNNGESTTDDIVITRNTITVSSVELEMQDDNVAHIKVTRFGDTTVDEFNAAVRRIQGNATGIVLDLRNNPGGYLYSSVSMASRMLPVGDVVVIEEDKNGDREELRTEGGNILGTTPIVILINEGSASASEILAGALKDNRDDVTIVGKQSFGKGSVQELIGLPKNAAVKITIAKWLTPNGNQINEVGIAPDVEVDLTTEDYENDRDPQLDKALELLKK
ncbi:S41 family peptidase [Patescibacteria group bacterium]